MRSCRLSFAAPILISAAASAEVIAGHSPVDTERTQVCTTVNQQQLSRLGGTTTAEVLPALPGGQHSPSGSGCPPPWPTDPVNKEALAGQNAERASEGLQPFVYNPALAQRAQAWAKLLVYIGQPKHSSREGRGDVRENISQGLPGWSVGQLQYSWFKEKQYLKPGGGIFPDVSTTGNWQDVGHITQIDWRLTTQMGCGLAAGRGYSYLVCDYSPGGNKDGKPFDVPLRVGQNARHLAAPATRVLAGNPGTTERLPVGDSPTSKVAQQGPVPHSKYDLVKLITPTPVEFEREIGKPEPPIQSESNEATEVPHFDPLELLRTDAWWTAWALEKANDECDYSTAQAMITKLGELTLRARGLAKASHMAAKSDNADAEAAETLVDDLEKVTVQARSDRRCKAEEARSGTGQTGELAPKVGNAATRDDEFGRYSRRSGYCSKQEQIDDLQALQYELIHTDESTAVGRASGKLLRAEIQRVKAAAIRPCEPAPLPGTTAIDIPPDVSPMTPSAGSGSKKVEVHKAAEQLKDVETSSPGLPVYGIDRIPNSPLEKFIHEAHQATFQMTRAIDECDFRAAKKLIPVLVEMSKRADDFANTAREAGKFSDVDPTELADLAWDLDFAMIDGNTFRICVRSAAQPE